MKHRVGYTILEVLIFIAVSALMFVSAVGAVSNRQRFVQFSQTVREFDLAIQDVMNDVATGYFPSSTQVNCRIVANTPQLTAVASSGVGTNKDCLYIGKAIHFAPSDAGISEPTSKYFVYNVVGKRFASGSGSRVPASTIDLARPTTADFSGLVEEKYLPFGVRITRVVSTDAGDTTKQFFTPVVSLLSSFEGAALNNGAESNAQSVSVAPIRPNVPASFNRVPASTAISMVRAMTVATANSTSEGYVALNPNRGVVVCLQDENNRRASLTIGGSGSTRTVLDIGNFRTECN